MAERLIPDFNFPESKVLIVITGTLNNYIRLHLKKSFLTDDIGQEEQYV
jgi:hypothetical protein